MTSDDGTVCRYCGAPARAWHGDIAWCGGSRCDVMHDWATHEPRLCLPPCDPTLWHRAWALLAYAFFRAIAIAVPITWMLDDHAGTLKQWLAVWCHSNNYSWWERMKGRL